MFRKVSVQYKMLIMNKKKSSALQEVLRFDRLLIITAGLALSAFSMTGYLWIKGNTTQVSDMVGNMPEIPNKNNFAMTRADEVKTVPQIELAADLPVSHNTTVVDGKKSTGDVKPKPGRDNKEKSRFNELIAFDAECENGIVQLYWATAGQVEETVKIEKRLSDNSYVTVIENPEPHRNGDLNSYEMKFENEGNQEMRFRLVRKADGSNKSITEYADVVCLESQENTPAIDVYPAGRGSFRIIVDGFAGETYTVSLKDLNEIELVTGEFEAVEGKNEFMFSTGNISRGSYSLKVSNGTVAIEKRISLK